MKTERKEEKGAKQIWKQSSEIRKSAQRRKVTSYFMFLAPGRTIVEKPVVGSPSLRVASVPIHT
jgi:hypothetical protein